MVGAVVIPELTSTNPVSNNGSYSFSVILANTHSLSNLIVRVGNDTLLPINNIYTIQNITTPKVIELLNVEINKYLIVASAGLNGTITPSGSSYINFNSDATFTFNPTVGFSVANVIVDGDSLGVMNSYTFSNVIDNHTIEVVFGLGSPDIIQSSQNNLFFTAFQYYPSNSQTSIISADETQLTINLLVKAPTHFQVSLNGTSWVSQVVIQKTNLPQELYIRFNPSIVGNISDTIKISSAGALTYLFVNGQSTVSILDNLPENLINVYPNPASNYVNIDLPNSILHQFEKVNFYDSSGKLLSSNNINNTNSVFDIHQWTNGIYYIEIFTDKKIYYKKLVIKK
jgi:hypothetical protein